MPNYIKQIKIGNTNYDLNALAIQDGSGNAKSWQDILDLMDAGFNLVVLDSLPTASAETYAQYKNSIVLVPSSNPGTQNVKDEYIIQESSGEITDGWKTLPTSYDNLDFITSSTPEYCYDTEYTFYIDGQLYSNVYINYSVNGSMKAITVQTINPETPAGQTNNFVYVYGASALGMEDGWYWGGAQPIPVTDPIIVPIYHELDGGTYGTLYPIIEGKEDNLKTILGISGGYSWEQIGSTQVDLSNYVTKGTYTTDASSGNTGSAGAETLSISYTGNATGSTVVTYDKATSVGDHTISAHSHTVNKSTASITFVSGVASGGTADAITGVEASGTTNVIASVSENGTATVATEGIKSVGLTASTTTSTGAITYTESITGSAPSLTGTTVFVTGYPNFSGGSKAADTFTPNTPTTIDTSKFSGGTFSQGAKASFSQGAKASLSYTATNDVMYGATVDANGVLSWSTATLSQITSWSANGTDTFTPNGDDSFTAATLNSGFYSAGTAAQFSEGAFTAASLGTASTGTVGISGGSYSGTTKYLKPSTTAAGTTTVLTGITSSTTSVITGVQASGSATVIKSTGLTTSSATFMTGATLSEAGATTLTHTITHTTTNINVSVAVPIDHEHTVTTSNHTHSLGNHTHDVNLN